MLPLSSPGTLSKSFHHPEPRFSCHQLEGKWDCGLGHASYIAECFADAKPKDSTILSTVTDSGSLNCHWFHEGVSRAKGHQSQQEDFNGKNDSIDTSILLPPSDSMMLGQSFLRFLGCLLHQNAIFWKLLSLLTYHTSYPPQVFLHFGRCYYCLSKKEPLLLC